MEHKAKGLCEKSFWLMLLLSPFLDLINGIWTYIQVGGNGGMLSTLDLPESGGMGPSLVIRMLFLALMLVYLLFIRHGRAIIMLAAIGFTWILTIAFEYIRGVEFSLSADISYIVRFCYCLVCLVAAERVLKAGAERFSLRERVDRVLCLAALTASLGVLIPYVFEIGFYTYADPLGYRGSRGFYYAGNDITVVIMLILPLMLASWMETEGKAGVWSWLQAVASALSVVALMLIGTKTAFVAIIVTGAVLLGYSLVKVFQEKSVRMLLRLLLVAVMAAAVFLLLSLLGANATETIKDSVAATGVYAETGTTGEVMLSGRTTYLFTAWYELLAGLPLTAIAGIGRGSQLRIIEMDVFEVVIYYGVLGAISMLWLYLSQGVKVVVDLFRAFSLRNLACCTALALCVGFLILAGHVLFSVTAGFYFAFLIAYTRLDCSRKGLEARII